MAYQSRYRRRRRRNSHYGVLIALLLVIVVAVPVGIKVIKGLSGAVFGGDKNQVVFQVFNTKALAGGEPLDLGGAAPFVDQNGSTVVPLRALGESLGLEVSWEQVSKTASLTRKKDTIKVQVGSKTLRLNDETKTMATAPAMAEGTTYVPVRDICEALAWKVGFVEAEQGHLIIVSKSKKDLSEEKIADAAAAALPVLGPSRAQIENGLLVMRADSDKLMVGGEVKALKDANNKSDPVIANEGKTYVPLQTAITALGGSAEYDGKAKWTVKLGEEESTVTDAGKAKVAGKTVKGDDIAVYRDAERDRFYVSAPLFAAIAGRSYADLGDGAFALTNVSLDGFDSQKAYIKTFGDGLSSAAAQFDIPEADAYIALTFDDGPTGPLDGYSEGLTAHLLNGLQERGAHATFYMVGERIRDFGERSMDRLVSEGHELGNHTMTHPMSKLTGLDAASAREQVDSNSRLIKEETGFGPTSMRPVGGGVNSMVKEQMKELGLPIVNWSVDTEDWRVRDKDSVRSTIVNNAADGAIVLMHDLYPTSIEGALAAIDELQQRTDKTYAFVTVSELAAVKGVTLEPGVVYNNLSDATVQSIADGTYAPTEFE